jgi:cytochrome c peroxidase
MRHDKRWVLLPALMLSSAFGAVACGDDDDTGPGGAGTAGTNSAGKGGAAGASGKGGSPEGGNAGDAGDSAGKGGTSGKGGTGGSGAGSAGTENTGAGEGGMGAASGSGGSGASAGSGGTLAGAGEGGDGGAGEAGSGAGSAGAAGESGNGGESGAASEIILTAEELAAAELQSPPPVVPANPTNRYADDAAAAALGQMLFFEKAYAGPLTAASDLGAVGAAGKISCASCHSSPGALADDRPLNLSGLEVSFGASAHTRNAPAIVDSARYRWTNWGGRFEAQWGLPPVVLENARIFNSSRLKLVSVLFAKYRTEYNAVFTDYPMGDDIEALPDDGKPVSTQDGVWETQLSDEQRAKVNRILVNFGKALEAYQRKLVSGPSRFDRFVAGTGDLSLDEQRGYRVFLNRGCGGCHSGRNFSDDGFHNLGVPHSTANVAASDDGRFPDAASLLGSGFNTSSTWSDDTSTGRLTGLTNPMPDSAHGAFRTPSLRGVARTGSYMHAGQFETLAAVIDFYEQGGGTVTLPAVKDAAIVPLTLSTGDKSDLEAFLRTLDGDPVSPALLEDTSKP